MLNHVLSQKILSGFSFHIKHLLIEIQCILIIQILHNQKKSHIFKVLTISVIGKFTKLVYSQNDKSGSILFLFNHPF